MANEDDKRSQFTFEIDPRLNAALERWRARKGLVKKDFASAAVFIFATLGPLEREAAFDRLDIWMRSGADEIPNSASVADPKEVESQADETATLGPKRSKLKEA